MSLLDLDTTEIVSFVLSNIDVGLFITIVAAILFSVSVTGAFKYLRNILLGTGHVMVTGFGEKQEVWKPKDPSTVDVTKSEASLETR